MTFKIGKNGVNLSCNVLFLTKNLGSIVYDYG